MNWRRIIFILVGIIILFAIVVGIHWLLVRNSQPLLPANAPGTTLPGSGPISIILSPDFGDAALSLGGLLARRDERAIVATFFTDGPTPAVTTNFDQSAGFTDSAVAANVRTAENERALSSLDAVSENYEYISQQYGQAIDPATLESEIAQDIQALIVANAGRPVSVYGPADFGSTTNADTEVLHNAFTDAINGFPGPNIRFFYYEAYPAVAAFNAASPLSLEKFLENESGLFLTTVNIPLSTGQVNQKISAINQYQSLMQSSSAIANGDQAYTSTRCISQACEVVYQIATSSAL